MSRDTRLFFLAWHLGYRGSLLLCISVSFQYLMRTHGGCLLVYLFFFLVSSPCRLNPICQDPSLNIKFSSLPHCGTRFNMGQLIMIIAHCAVLSLFHCVTRLSAAKYVQHHIRSLYAIHATKSQAPTRFKESLLGPSSSKNRPIPSLRNLFARVKTQP